MSNKKLVETIGQFITIPFSFQQEGPRITNAEYRLFGVLRYYTNINTGNSWPSYETLRAETGMKRDTISKAIKGLVAKGWLEKEIRSGSSTVYTLQIPSPEKGTTGSPEKGTGGSPQKGTRGSPEKGTLNRLSQIDKVEIDGDRVTITRNGESFSYTPMTPEEQRRRGIL